MNNAAQQIKVTDNIKNDSLPRNITVTLDYIIADIKVQTSVKEEVKYRFSKEKGIQVLFAGLDESGKTEAAKVMASSLGWEILRVDLSLVVSKDIEETKKNLKEIYDRAEESDVVLFFDEADALFGKETEGEDSKKKYTSAEATHFLKSIEKYRSLVIFAANLTGIIDDTVMRRFEYMLDFPSAENKGNRQITKSLTEEVGVDAANYR